MGPSRIRDSYGVRLESRVPAILVRAAMRADGCCAIQLSDPRHNPSEGLMNSSSALRREAHARTTLDLGQQKRPPSQAAFPTIELL